MIGHNPRGDRSGIAASAFSEDVAAANVRLAQGCRKMGGELREGGAERERRGPLPCAARRLSKSAGAGRAAGRLRSRAGP